MRPSGLRSSETATPRPVQHLETFPCDLHSPYLWSTEQFCVLCEQKCTKSPTYVDKLGSVGSWRSICETVVVQMCSSLELNTILEKPSRLGVKKFLQIIWWFIMVNITMVSSSCWLRVSRERMVYVQSRNAQCISQLHLNVQSST